MKRRRRGLLIKSYLVEPEISYTGKELAPHWIYRNFSLQGDAIVAFIGPCQVVDADLVDLEDRKNKKFIFSEKMLHFLIEHFNLPLPQAILQQRLLICLIEETLLERQIAVKRNGDDLFWQSRKLSVSIATVSMVSALIHVGINISSANTPLPTADLTEMGLEPRQVAAEIMEKYAAELESMHLAQCKVRGV